MISPGRMFRETVRVLQASVCWNPHCNILNLRPIVEVFASSNLGGPSTEHANGNGPGTQPLFSLFKPRIDIVTISRSYRHMLGLTSDPC
jgi:hypothetical protein